MRIIGRPLMACVLSSVLATASAGSGPLGIDSRLDYDGSGIWNRSNQKALAMLLIAGEVIGAAWEGSDTRLGRTFYQAIDASILGGVSTEVLKRTFRRTRPSESDDPDQWFKHGGRSFPSGEITLLSAVFTPFMMEYGPDHPEVYALGLVLLYDAQARMKTQGHWQTDILAGVLVGAAASRYAHSRRSSFTVGILPRGITVGWRTRF